MTKKMKTYALCGMIRARGESDAALIRLCTQDKITKGLIPPPPK